MTDYTIIILGGTGQVGAAVVRALLNSSRCREVIMITRRAAASTFGERVRPVVMDTNSATFEQEVAKLVSTTTKPVYGVSCVGIGSGSAKWSEEDILKLEVGVVSAFARGCKASGVSTFALLSAAGASSDSWVRYLRHMGLKEDAIAAIGFTRLAIFRPGIIAGNSHTPGYVAALGRWLPGKGGTIEQDDIGKAFVRELERGDEVGTTILHNRDMRTG
ncbi:MAG: NAD(P)H-binding protein [Pseudolabrys sp.]|nr:NAD(P)H-binding protein [Pseudolabrys sp.]